MYRSQAVFSWIARLVPTRATSDLLAEADRALLKYDIKTATQLYHQIPEADRQCKPVIGFYHRIEEVKRRKEYLKKIEESICP
ncbi:MAG: hypothetical protein Q7V63_05775 [Gammaproteobacteria bacterium]|nr:hypothetical protein [Gammaproteobacteria bacterium]